MHVLAAKSHQDPHLIFGVQVHKNQKHVKALDEMTNSTLWVEANKKEITSLKEFKTFCALDKGEPIPKGYIQIPYHMVFDVKITLNWKARLVADGHKVPEVVKENTFSSVPT